jgi:hypothetical protein
MSPNEIDKRIAIACGWKDVRYTGIFVKGIPPDWNDTDRFEIPDYHRDLNAMHKAEKVLSRGENYNQTGGFGRYKTALAEVCDEQHPIDATAAQRAEAFLRTIAQWEDGK